MTHDGHFGEPVAAHDDEGSDAMFAPEVVDPTVDFLVAAAAGGPTLELGIGTGRVALRLRRVASRYRRSICRRPH